MPACLSWSLQGGLSDCREALEDGYGREALSADGKRSDKRKNRVCAIKRTFFFLTKLTTVRIMMLTTVSFMEAL